MCNVTIHSQNCGASQYKELRVAFGNMENCQLKCPFCFTSDQKPSIDKLSDLNELDFSNIKSIRFTGGEPFREQSQINGIIRELQLLESQRIENLDLVILQTNGIDIEKKDIDALFDIDLPILLEISFKGTNIDEFQHLTFPTSINKKNAETIMYRQFEGYKLLSIKCKGKSNISILGRLGVFHSSIKNPTFKFIYPESRELMFYPENWNQVFKDIYEDQINIWGSLFDEKMVVEKLKTPGDGSPNMGKRYRCIIENLKGKNILEEKKSKLPTTFQNHYYYKRGNLIYSKIAEVLKSQ